MPTTDADLSVVRELFEVNLFGVIAMCQEFIPLLRKSKHPNGARIVNIGSVAGVAAVPFDAAYCASKAALHSFSDTLRMELKPFK